MERSNVVNYCIECQKLKHISLMIMQSVVLLGQGHVNSIQIGAPSGAPLLARVCMVLFKKNYILIQIMIQ